MVCRLDQSASFRIFDSTFYFPHSAIPHFTHSLYVCRIWINSCSQWSVAVDYENYEKNTDEILTLGTLKYSKYTHVLFGLSSLTTGDIFSFQSSITQCSIIFRS